MPLLGTAPFLETLTQSQRNTVSLRRHVGLKPALNQYDRPFAMGAHVAFQKKIHIRASRGFKARESEHTFTIQGAAMFPGDRLHKFQAFGGNGITSVSGLKVSKEIAHWNPLRIQVQPGGSHPAHQLRGNGIPLCGRGLPEEGKVRLSTGCRLFKEFAGVVLDHSNSKHAMVLGGIAASINPLFTPAPCSNEPLSCNKRSVARAGNPSANPSSRIFNSAVSLN